MATALTVGFDMRDRSPWWIKLPQEWREMTIKPGSHGSVEGFGARTGRICPMTLDKSPFSIRVSMY